jgi:hypothetical protein
VAATWEKEQPPTSPQWNAARHAMTVLKILDINGVQTERYGDGR